MNVFTDTHSHFDFAAFDPDREAVVAECLRRGVHRVLVPGVTREQVDRLPAFALDWSGAGFRVLVAAGLHPAFPETPGRDDTAQWLNGVLASDEPFVAVGEIGLHAPAGNMEQQIRVLEDQLAVARNRNLPVILHQVGAHNAMVRALKRVPPVAGVLHAFTGSPEMAKAYTDLGLTLGVGGAVTYPRAKKTQRAIASVAAECLVLETDAPDMPLCGFQGVRNSPVQIPSVFHSLSALHAGIRPEALARQLEANAAGLFGSG